MKDVRKWNDGELAYLRKLIMKKGDPPRVSRDSIPSYLEVQSAIALKNGFPILKNHIDAAIMYVRMNDWPGALRVLDPDEIQKYEDLNQEYLRSRGK